MGLVEEKLPAFKIILILLILSKKIPLIPLIPSKFSLGKSVQSKINFLPADYKGRRKGEDILRDTAAENNNPARQHRLDELPGAGGIGLAVRIDDFQAAHQAQTANPA